MTFQLKHRIKDWTFAWAGATLARPLDHTPSDCSTEETTLLDDMRYEIISNEPEQDPRDAPPQTSSPIQTWPSPHIVFRLRILCFDVLRSRDFGPISHSMVGSMLRNLISPAPA